MHLLHVVVDAAHCQQRHSAHSTPEPGLLLAADIELLVGITVDSRVRPATSSKVLSLMLPTILNHRAQQLQQPAALLTAVSAVAVAVAVAVVCDDLHEDCADR